MADRSVPPWPPRGLPEEQAAYYIGLGITTFRAEEAKGQFRATWLTERRKVYLRDHLDAYLDRKAGSPAAAPVDDVPDWQKALDADRQDQDQRRPGKKAPGR